MPSTADFCVGINVLGPNCPGFVNIAEGVSAYGQDICAGMKSGQVSIVLQSASLPLQMGLSKIICMVNEAVIQAAGEIGQLPRRRSMTSVIQ